jgi:hypothetical protein
MKPWISPEYLKKALKSRTVWFGMAISGLGFIQSIVYEFPVSPAIQGVIGVILGAAIVLLRMDTDDAIDDK